MSSPPSLRRVDRLMAGDKARDFLKAGFAGRLATVSEDGSPYCLPFLYVWMDDSVFFHNTIARGHLRHNVDHERRICFLVDEPEQVFDYGRFECDTGLAYRSVVVFGTIDVVDDPSLRQRFFETLMEKYGTPDRDRPRGFFPRIGEVTVYAISIERITGKECLLPGVAERWPALDRTKSPNAQLPKPASRRNNPVFPHRFEQEPMLALYGDLNFARGDYSWPGFACPSLGIRCKNRGAPTVRA